MYLIGTDSSNARLSLIDLTDSNKILDVYHPGGATRVLNVLLPDPYDERELCLCAIQSLDVTRLVGVILRRETCFQLVIVHWSGEPLESTSSAAEFYRVDTEKFVVNAPDTSLCAVSARRVFCAVADSHRLSAFELIGRGAKRQLKAIGKHTFDEAIVHVDAVNASAGVFVAVAFRDESIRLYLQVNGTAEQRGTDFEYSSMAISREDTFGNDHWLLQETCRVHCENVHSLLWSADGGRLLVAERAEDEETDRLWSCALVGERLDCEGAVQCDAPLAVLCWRSHPASGTVYCVDQQSGDALELQCARASCTVCCSSL